MKDYTLDIVDGPLGGGDLFVRGVKRLQQVNAGKTQQSLKPSRQTSFSIPNVKIETFEADQVLNS